MYVRMYGSVCIFGFEFNFVFPYWETVINVLWLGIYDLEF